MFRMTEPLPSTSIPNHWIRDWRMSSNLYRLLSFWASHAEGYEVTIEQTVAETPLSRDTVYEVLLEGRYLKYLIPLPPDNEGGRFGAQTYTLGPAAFEERYVRNWGASDPADDRPRRGTWQRPTRPEIRQAVRETAGHDQWAKPVHGNPVCANPDAKGFNSLGVQSSGDQNPLSAQPRTNLGQSATRGPKGGDDSKNQKPTPTPDIVALAGRLASVRPGGAGRWTPRIIMDVVLEAQRLGHPRKLIERALEIAAGDPMTKHPRRILADGWPGWDEIEEHARIADVAARSLAESRQRAAERTTTAELYRFDAPTDEDRQRAVQAGLAAAGRSWPGADRYLADAG